MVEFVSNSLRLGDMQHAGWMVVGGLVGQSCAPASLKSAEMLQQAS